MSTEKLEGSFLFFYLGSTILIGALGEEVIRTFHLYFSADFSRVPSSLKNLFPVIGQIRVSRAFSMRR